MYIENGNIKVLKHTTDAELASVVSDKIAVKEIRDVAIVVLVEGVADEDVTFSLAQHAGATNKLMALTKPVLAKLGSAEAFSEAVITEGEDANALKYTIPVGAESGLFVIGVEATDLDINGAFSELSLTVEAVKKNITILAIYEATNKPAYKQEI